MSAYSNNIIDILTIIKKQKCSLFLILMPCLLNTLVLAAIQMTNLYSCKSVRAYKLYACVSSHLDYCRIVRTGHNPSRLISVLS